MSHTAVILIALGGPRTIGEIGPFISSFMGRPAPQPLVDIVVKRYELIGGSSPLPGLVTAQAQALGRELGAGFRTYAGFRYTAPLIGDSVAQALQEGADRVIGLSLSPYETRATTGLYREAFDAALDNGVRKSFIPSWHDNPLFIRAWEDRIFHGLKRYREALRRHAAVVFTSHSIPLRFIEAGDPYRQQIEETAHIIAKNMALSKWYIAWQSKGARTTEPWLEPEVETIIDMIAMEKKSEFILEVPLGFTCDHLETLYDINIVHRQHAESQGLIFERTESLNSSPIFIKALADIVRRSL